MYTYICILHMYLYLIVFLRFPPSWQGTSTTEACILPASTLKDQGA